MMARPARPARPVHGRCGGRSPSALHRQAVVDDVGDGGHVDAASRLIGGHQRAAGAQLLPAAVALALRHGAVQPVNHGVADLGQALGQPVGIALEWK